MSHPSSLRLAAAAIVALCTMFGCAKTKTPSEQLAGVWLLDGSGSKTIEFKADGAVVLRARQKVDGPVARWAVLEPGKVEMTFDRTGTEFKQVVEFELKGDDELTLKNLPANARGHYRRIAADALAGLPPAPPKAWVYEDRIGKTPDARERSATATSGELTDGSIVDLTIRERGADGLAVLIDPGDERHGFACSTGCTFSVRFDDQPPVQYALGPQRGSPPYVVYFDDKAALVGRLKNAKRMVVEASVGDKDTRVYEFRTAGLQW